MMFGFTPPYPQVVPGLDTSGNKADWSRQPADHCCAVCTTAEASTLFGLQGCVYCSALTACWGPARVPALPELLVRDKLLCLLDDWRYSRVGMKNNIFGSRLTECALSSTWKVYISSSRKLYNSTHTYQEYRTLSAQPTPQLNQN